MKTLTLLILLLNGFQASRSCSRPTILIHGIASSREQLEPFAEHLRDKDHIIYNVEIGNGFLDSIFMNMNTQCELFNIEIEKLNISNEKINIIGFSQGGLTSRCYVEKYSHLTKNVSKLITIGTPHEGIYYEKWPYDGLIKYEYTKDPFLYEKYLEKNNYLVYLNNEKNHENSQIYKNNMKTLDLFVNIYSKIDEVIVPYQSSFFEFYNIEKAKNSGILEVEGFNKSYQYTCDLIGLKYLITNNKYTKHNIECSHDRFKESEELIEFINQIL
jgi:esterase/lipase